jgi:predicted TIM-barrel enzyme
VKEARENCNLPVFVGSGVRIENLSQFLPVADGMIIGSAFKRGGSWRDSPDPARIRSLVQRAADILAFEAQAGPLFRV